MLALFAYANANVYALRSTILYRYRFIDYDIYIYDNEVFAYPAPRLAQI